MPLFYQEQALTCEAACLKMCIFYFGWEGVSEGTLLRQLRPSMRMRDGIRWDDPNERFVGMPHGEMCTAGYGVHCKPVAGVAVAYCRRSFWMSCVTLSQLVHFIDVGCPVIVWCVDRPEAGRDAWITPKGIVVHVWRGTHVKVVIGYTDGLFVINDPIRGRIDEQFETLLDSIRRSGGGCVVVVP